MHKFHQTQTASISRKEEKHKAMCNMKERWSYVRNTPRKLVWFKTKNFEFQDKICPKKKFWRQNLKKIAKFRINTLELLSFIWNKALWSFGTIFAQNKCFGNGIWKSNCQIQNEHPWVHLCTELYLKQSTLKFSEQVCPKKVFLGTEFKKKNVN